MPLHEFVEAPETTLSGTYASPSAEHELPRYRMPAQSSDPGLIFNLVRDELFLDGNSRQNLATFCTTYVDDEVRPVMNLAVDKNMIDKDEYPQTAEIERRCVHILADLWHAPHPARTIGCSTTGSSEAAMLGGLALKWQWRKRRAAAGKPSDRPNLVCGPVQVCWEKFARYFDVELRQVPLSGDSLGLQAETGLDIPIHVDGASGGFVAPFIQPDLAWDFRIERVKSINASGHKYGLAPLGVGWAVWHTKEDLPEDLIFSVDYLGGNMPTFALNFSRPAGEIIAQYYNLMRFGREGYRAIHQSCADTAQYLAGEIAKLGPLELIYDGKGALPAVCYRLKDPAKAGFTLYDLSERVRMRGWQIASYPLPPKRQETVVQRILIRRGVSRDMAGLLLDDIKRGLKYLEANPVAHSTAGPSFHHN